MIVIEGIILDWKTTNRLCRIVANYFLPITIGNAMKVFIEVLSLIIFITRRILNVTDTEFMLTYISAAEKSGYKQMLFEKKYFVL